MSVVLRGHAYSASTALGAWRRGMNRKVRILHLALSTATHALTGVLTFSAIERIYITYSRSTNVSGGARDDGVWDVSGG